ncbi:MAG: hypothetical protein V1904_12385 [Bacteroidota bacterium]
MIYHLTNNEIDKQKWDECILNSFNGLIYAYSWYLDIVCPGWEALVENEYERVFPITARKKSGIDYLFQPFFTQQLGVFSKNILNENIIDEFLCSIPGKFRLIEINLNVFNKIDASKHEVRLNKNYELDLIASYDILYKNYSENTKRNLKTAEKSDLSILKNFDHRKIIELFLMHRGKNIETLNDRAYKTFSKLIDVLSGKNLAHIWGVKSPEEDLCAAAIFIESNKRVIFIFSATGIAARSNGAMTFLIDNFIRENVQRNIILDFEGSNDLNLARFYKGFGSTECTYFQYKKNKLPQILSKSITFIKWFRKQI